MYSETLRKLLNRVLTLVSKCTDDISLELDCFRDVEILSAASSNLLEFMKVSHYDCMKFLYIYFNEVIHLYNLILKPIIWFYYYQIILMISLCVTRILLIHPIRLVCLLIRLLIHCILKNESVSQTKLNLVVQSWNQFSALLSPFPFSSRTHCMIFCALYSIWKRSKLDRISIILSFPFQLLVMTKLILLI